jgi:hypothetical protein
MTTAKVTTQTSAGAAATIQALPNNPPNLYAPDPSNPSARQYTDGLIGKVQASDGIDAAFPPELSGISPASGTHLGGTPVTITGKGFTGATGAKIDVNALTSFVVVSDTEITGHTAADSRSLHGVISANVSVTGPNGTGYILEGFTYT